MCVPYVQMGDDSVWQMQWSSVDLFALYANCSKGQKCQEGRSRCRLRLAIRSTSKWWTTGQQPFKQKIIGFLGTEMMVDALKKVSFLIHIQLHLFHPGLVICRPVVGCKQRWRRHCCTHKGDIRALLLMASNSSSSEKCLFKTRMSMAHKEIIINHTPPPYILPDPATSAVLSC